mmetsp:Transcript_25039/g.56517  ORF Transcript_25039/g.56517 Transcript_25039/m.56517 type:complete len:282 (-) Transcript_25039:16-861(-)
MILHHTDQAASCLVHRHVREAELSLRGEGNRIDAGKRQLSIDPLVHEVDKVDDAFVHDEISAAVLVHAASHVEGGRCEVHRLSSFHLDDHLSPSLIGTRLQPVEILPIKGRGTQPYRPVGDVLGGDGGVPLAVGKRRDVWGLGHLLLSLLRPLENLSRAVPILHFLHPQAWPARPEAGKGSPVTMEACRWKEGRLTESDGRSEGERRCQESKEQGQDDPLHQQCCWVKSGRAQTAVRRMRLRLRRGEQQGRSRSVNCELFKSAEPRRRQRGRRQGGGTGGF